MNPSGEVASTARWTEDYRACRRAGHAIEPESLIEIVANLAPLAQLIVGVAR